MYCLYHLLLLEHRDLPSVAPRQFEALPLQILEERTGSLGEAVHLLPILSTWRAGHAAINDAQTCAELTVSPDILPKRRTDVVKVCQISLSPACLFD